MAFLTKGIKIILTDLREEEPYSKNIITMRAELKSTFST